MGKKTQKTKLNIIDIIQKEYLQTINQNYKNNSLYEHETVC